MNLIFQLYDKVTTLLPDMAVVLDFVVAMVTSVVIETVLGGSLPEVDRIIEIHPLIF